MSDTVDVLCEVCKNAWVKAPMEWVEDVKWLPICDDCEKAFEGEKEKADER
jgi:hypothetical protein